MMMKFKMIAALSASALLLGACASKQDTAELGEEIVVTGSKDTNAAKSGEVDGAAMRGFSNNGAVQPAAAIGDRVYFDLNDNRLDSDDQALLSMHAQKISSDPSMRILVAGNCDERGTREYNLALGERRAETVKSYLVSLGIDAGRIDTVSYGKERPIAAESNEKAWATNRNGFIQVLTGQAS
jgi:peptidoglycan-associated lipoprotein